MPAYKESDSKHWYCKFYYKDYAGKRRQKLKRGFTTRRDALAYEAEYKDGSLSGSLAIVEQVYVVYMAEMEHRLKLSTINFKKNIFETKILPYFGRLRLGAITPQMICKWQERLAETDLQLSTSYIRTINSQFRAFLSYAKIVYGLEQNPFDRIAPVSGIRPTEVSFWTPDEYLKFRESTRVEPLAYICFEMLYWTGMRAGEMLALTTDDISFDLKEISISKTYTKISGHEYVWEPKTPSSVRRVMMPGFLIRELKFYLESVGTLSKNARIFPVDTSWLCYRIHKYARLAGVREIKVHSLRHSAASLLINEGFGALEVAKRLGHSKVTTSLNIYSHLFPTKQDEIVKRLEKIGG